LTGLWQGIGGALATIMLQCSTDSGATWETASYVTQDTFAQYFGAVRTDTLIDNDAGVGGFPNDDALSYVVDVFSSKYAPGSYQNFANGLWQFFCSNGNHASGQVGGYVPSSLPINAFKILLRGSVPMKQGTASIFSYK